MTVVAGLIADSDLLVRVGTAAGLRFDLSLDERESYSNKTRIRALLPRIIAAYDGLPEDLRLTAARAAVVEIRKTTAVPDDALAESLGRAGWELRDSEFVVKSPETRELFFPKGSPWDAFVVLRDVFAEAKASITVIANQIDRGAGKLEVTGVPSRRTRRTEGECVLIRENGAEDVHRQCDGRERFTPFCGSFGGIAPRGGGVRLEAPGVMPTGSRRSDR
jgi:hypothetical protein